MNERSIITITIVSTCCFVVLLVALILMILVLRKRCKKSKAATQETDRGSAVLEEGLTNLGVDGDGLVSATKQRNPENRHNSQKMDRKFEEILDNAYSDARQFAKFPHLP